MFNPIFGLYIDWSVPNEPVTTRPIPMCYYDKKHILYAIRHPNKALTITKGCHILPLPPIKKEDE